MPRQTTTSIILAAQPSLRLMAETTNTQQLVAIIGIVLAFMGVSAPAQPAAPNGNEPDERLEDPIVGGHREAVCHGQWSVGTNSAGKGQQTYIYCAAASATNECSATFHPHIPEARKYDVEIRYPAGTNHSPRAMWIISSAEGESRMLVDQTTNGGLWLKIGAEVPFKAGTNGFVRLVNKAPGAHSRGGHEIVVADAIRLVPPDSSVPMIDPPELTAADIIDVLTDSYQSASTFRSTAVDVHEMRYADETNLHVISTPFSIEVARPKFCRFAWGDKADAWKKGAVWANEDGIFEIEHGEVKKVSNLQYTLDWKNPKPLVSELFFHTEQNWLDSLKNCLREADDKIEGEECYVIIGETYGRRITLWITKDDFLLKQWREETVSSPMPAPSNSSGEGTAARSSTPTNSVASKSTKPALTALMSKQRSATHTITFRVISRNHPFAVNDFSSANIPGLSDRNDPDARRLYGRVMMFASKYADAAGEFLWCWDNGRASTNFASIRQLYLLNDMLNLGKTYPVILESIASRRDQLEQKILAGAYIEPDVQDLCAINSKLDTKRTLALFDRLPADAAARKRLAPQVASQLVEARRYRDVAAAMDVQAALTDEIEDASRTVALLSGAGAKMFKDWQATKWAAYMEVLAGLQQTAEARDVSDRILQFQPTPETKAILERHAVHAGNQDVVNYLRSKNLTNSAAEHQSRSAVPLPTTPAPDR